MLKCTKTKDYQKIIKECYESDTDLIIKYHVKSPIQPRGAILHTLQVFQKAKDFTVYELKYKGLFAGYFGIEKSDIKVIKGFFIMPEFRSKTIYKLFWETVKRVAKEDVYIPVYQKNIRAKNFLIREKCKFVKQLLDSEENQLVNIYKLCHSEEDLH